MSSLIEYAPALAMANFLLIAVVGIMAQHEYSKFMKAKYGQDVPRWSLGRRTEGLMIALRILFNGESKAPIYFKILVLIYRFLWISFLAEIIFLLFTWGKD